MSEDDEQTDAPTEPVSSGARPRWEDNSLGRLLTLCDGVFAIAMTLLALDLAVPDGLGKHPSSHALRLALGNESSSFLSYLISFYVVGIYWMRHRRLMRSVVTLHPALIRDTMLLLVVVAAMPFPASLLGRYGGVPIALAVYGGVNAIATAALMLLSHDVQRFELADHPTRDWARRWQTWWTLGVFLLCIPGGYVLRGHGPWLLALVVVPDRVDSIRGWIGRRRGRGDGASPRVPDPGVVG